MLGALKSLLNSEKAVAGGVLIICATVLAIAGNMQTQQWIDYTTWIFGIYVAGKTVQGASATMAARPVKAPSALGLRVERKSPLNPDPTTTTTTTATEPVEVKS